MPITGNTNVNVDDVIRKLNVETTILYKEDILSLLKDSLDKNELFAKEFNEKIIKPLTQKIERKIRVDDIFIDGKKIGSTITKQLVDSSKKSIKDASAKIDEKLQQGADIKFEINTKDLVQNINDNLKKATESPLKKFSANFLKSMTGFSFESFFDQAPENTKKLGKQYQRVMTNFLDNLEKSLKENTISVNSKEFDYSSLMGVSPDLSRQVTKKWNNIRQRILTELDKGVPKTKFDTGGKDAEGKPIAKINFSDILGHAPSKDLPTWLQWNRTRRKLLQKIENNVDVIKFDEKNKLKVTDILGDTPSMGLTTWLKFNKTRKNLLDKIDKGIEDIDFKKTEKLNITDILGDTPSMGLTTWLKFNKTRKNLLDKIDKSIEGINFDETQKLNITDIIGVPNNDSLLMNFQYMNFKRKLFKKIVNKFDAAEFDTSDILGFGGKDKDKNTGVREPQITKKEDTNPEAIVETKEGGAEEPGSKFKSLLEKDKTQEVVIGSFKPKAKKEIEEILTKSGKKTELLKKKSEQGAGGLGIGDLAKEALMQKLMGGGSKVAAGGLSAGATTALTSIPIVAAAAVAGYYIHKKGKEAEKALKQEGKTIERSAQMQKEGWNKVRQEQEKLTKSYGEEFTKRWDAVLKSSEFKERVAKKPDETKPVIYQGALQQIAEQLEKDKTPKKQDINKPKQVQDWQGRAQTIVDKAGQVLKPASDDIVTAKKQKDFGYDVRRNQYGSMVAFLPKEDARGGKSSAKALKASARDLAKELGIPEDKIDYTHSTYVSGKCTSVAVKSEAGMTGYIRATNKREAEFALTKKIMSQDEMLKRHPMYREDGKYSAFDLDILKKDFPNNPNIGKKPLRDFIWRKGQPAQPFDASDNIISIKSDKKFDKIVNTLKQTLPSQETGVKQIQGIEGVQSEIRQLSKMFSQYLTVQLKRDSERKPSTMQQFESLGGISDDAGDIRDPAYILRNRVWDKFNRTHTIL